MRGHSPSARLLLEKAQWATATARSLPKLRAPEMDGGLVAHESGATCALLVACFACSVMHSMHGSSRQRVRAVLTTPHRSPYRPHGGRKNAGIMTARLARSWLW